MAGSEKGPFGESLMCGMGLLLVMGLQGAITAEEMTLEETIHVLEQIPVNPFLTKESS